VVGKISHGEKREHPLLSWGAGMVGGGGGKPASWRHACMLLGSQSSLDSFNTPTPETALEGDPSPALADRKLGVPQPLGPG